MTNHHKGRRRVATAFAAVAAFLLPLTLLYAAVATFAFDPSVYMQTPPYGAMAAELVSYLRGGAATLSEGLFTVQERLHMEDVLVLFRGGRRIAMSCLILGAGLLIASLCLGGRRRLGRGMLLGLAAFAACAAAIGLWAALDFQGWFYTMHEIVFSNDLWLLDPAESMLIRMMPLDFFQSAVSAIAVRFGLGMAGLLLAGIICGFAGQKKEET